MARSRETFNKKEVRNKKEKKRKDKAKKKLERKENKKENTLDDMIAYVDEYGNITSSPPDNENKEEINAEDIEVSIPKKTHEDTQSEGRVTFFDTGKNYGFITDSDTRQSVFVHQNNCLDTISEGDLVTFETERTPRGFSALRVQLKK